jgi:hypothetical protein
MTRGTSGRESVGLLPNLPIRNGSTHGTLWVLSSP